MLIVPDAKYSDFFCFAGYNGPKLFSWPKGQEEHATQRLTAKSAPLVYPSSASRRGEFREKFFGGFGVSVKCRDQMTGISFIRGQRWFGVAALVSKINSIVCSWPEAAIGFLME